MGHIDQNIIQMKIKCFFLTAIFCIGFIGCASWRQSILPAGSKDVVISNAINDFINNCYLSKDDNVFSVDLVDRFRGNIIAVSILGDDHPDAKLWVLADDTIGSSTHLPTQYIIQKGKLFYWNDTLCALTQEIVDVMSAYGRLDTSKYRYDGLGGLRDDSKKGCTYYFCKDNLRYYKRVVSSRSSSLHLAPNMVCRSYDSIDYRHWWLLDVVDDRDYVSQSSLDEFVRCFNNKYNKNIEFSKQRDEVLIGIFKYHPKQIRRAISRTKFKRRKIIYDVLNNSRDSVIMSAILKSQTISNSCLVLK